MPSNKSLKVFGSTVFFLALFVFTIALPDSIKIPANGWKVVSSDSEITPQPGQCTEGFAYGSENMNLKLKRLKDAVPSGNWLFWNPSNSDCNLEYAPASHDTGTVSISSGGWMAVNIKQELPTSSASCGCNGGMAYGSANNMLKLKSYPEKNLPGGVWLLWNPTEYACKINLDGGLAPYQKCEEGSCADFCASMGHSGSLTNKCIVIQMSDLESGVGIMCNDPNIFYGGGDGAPCYETLSYCCCKP